MALLPSCPLSELSSCLPAALSLEGAVVVTGVPSLPAARSSALSALFSCATRAPRSMETALMDDGTRRLSAGSHTLAGASAGFPECPQLDTAAASLRAAVQLASSRVIEVLAPLASSADRMLPSAGGGGYPTLAEVTHHGEQLEHFHAYFPPSPKPSSPSPHPADPIESRDTIGLHTDGGLFIAMLPGMYARASPKSGEFEPIEDPQPGTSGFLVQRADGTMAGEAAAP